MAQSSEGRNLENIVGPLDQTVPQLEPSSIQDAAQITAARRTDESLRNQWVYTANSNVYTFEDGEAIWYSGRGETNPIFDNTAIRQLLENRNCSPSREAIEAVKSADTSLRVKLSDLGLQNLIMSSLTLKLILLIMEV